MPSVQAIASYIGMSPPRCLICLKTPVERAHAVPKSLEGSYDLRNFALLCPDHHKQAPDIADAEGFWAWIDYMGMRQNRAKHGWPASDHPRMLGIYLPLVEGSANEQVEFIQTVQRELVELYGWGEEGIRFNDLAGKRRAVCGIGKSDRVSFRY